MAQIDPERQRRLNAVVLEFGAACQRMQDAATLATLEMAELAAVLDKDMAVSIAAATAAAIRNARS